MSFKRTFLPEPNPLSKLPYESFPPERKQTHPDSAQKPRSFAPDVQPQSNISVIITPSSKRLSFPQTYSGSPSRTYEGSKGLLNTSQPVSTSGNLATPNGSRIAVVIPVSSPEKLLIQQSSPLKQRQTPATHSTPKKRGRPFATPGAASRAADKAARRAAQLASGETGRLRRRKADSVSGSRTIAAHEHEHAKHKKKGRPFLIRHHVEVPPPEPKYIPFLCEWKNCPAELHNLDTLRLHVLNVHKKKPSLGRRRCYWRRCDGQEEFDTKEKWEDHIIEKHLIPFAWHMGDGVRGPTLG